jgi:AmmeMemoRadiSam system protein A
MYRESFPPRLAKRAIREYLHAGKVISLPAQIPKEFQKQAGAFVSLYEGGQLRGCIGTYLPQQKNVAGEIVRNAISAATRDPRFPAVRKSELGTLQISVDVLSAPEPVLRKEGLDAAIYGVIVSKGRQRGLLLPNLKGVDTVEEQLAIARQKAGLAGVPDENVEIQRFMVIRYDQNDKLLYL